MNYYQIDDSNTKEKFTIYSCIINSSTLTTSFKLKDYGQIDNVTIAHLYITGISLL